MSEEKKWDYYEEIALGAEYVAEHEEYKKARDAVRSHMKPICDDYPHEIERFKALMGAVLKWTRVCYLLGFDAGMMSAVYAQSLKTQRE